MRNVYQKGVGRKRREIHKRVEAVFEDELDCHPRRVASFCKLLDDASTFDADRRGKAAALRLKVFGLAAKYHPLVEEPDKWFEFDESEVKNAIAEELGRSWVEIESGLYADVIDCQRLLEHQGYPDSAALLSRYNVAQVQACLYRAERMRVEASMDFKTIIRYAKLAGLLHDITRLGPSRYLIELSGQASVLRRTNRSGVNMARFLPALLCCEGWKMSADLIAPHGGRARLSLDEGDGLKSHLDSPPEFDSAIEEKFAKKFGEKRDGWTLVREGEILHHRQRAYVPDFVFRHDRCAEVLFEIAGFWTPEYIEARVKTIKLFSNRRFIIAVPEKSASRFEDTGAGLVTYKTTIKLAPVMSALNDYINPTGPTEMKKKTK